MTEEKFWKSLFSLSEGVFAERKGELGKNINRVVAKRMRFLLSENIIVRFVERNRVNLSSSLSKQGLR